MLWALSSRFGSLTQERRFEAVEDGGVDSGADALGAEAAQRMGDDQAVEFGQAALLGFELEQVGEG